LRRLCGSSVRDTLRWFAESINFVSYCVRVAVDGQPLSATALHSDAKLLLDAKYTIATALELRSQRQSLNLSTADMQNMLWEALALAEFFGARLVQEEGLRHLQQLVDHTPEQLQDTLRRWIAKVFQITRAALSRLLPRITMHLMCRTASAQWTRLLLEFPTYCLQRCWRSASSPSPALLNHRQA
jgi:hypothetical protein